MINQKTGMFPTLLVGSILGLLASTSVLAEEITVPDVSLEKYQAAIESFGVPPTQARATAKNTVGVIAQNRRQLANENIRHDPLAGLLDSFINESPYAID